MFIGYQCMLFGLSDHEIVVEVEVPKIHHSKFSEKLTNIEAEFALQILKEVEWKLTVPVETWQVERQELHQRG